MTNSIFYKRLSGSSIQGDATQVTEPQGTVVIANDGSLRLHDGTTAGGNAITTTVDHLTVRNSLIQLDGSSVAWAGLYGAGDYNYGGFFSSDTNNTLFTFSASGSPSMSVQLDGALFVGGDVPSNAAGVNITNPGWIVASGGAKFGGGIDTLGQISGVDGYLDLNGDGSIVLNASYTNVNINLQTTNGVYTQLWDFQASGNLVLPNSNIISSSQQTGETNIQIVDGSNSFKVYTHASDGAQEWDFQADGTFVVPGSVNSQANTGAVVINAHTGTTTKTWTFDVDGSLSIPGTVLASPDFKVQLGVPIDVGAPISSNGSWDANQGPNIATTGGSGSGLTVDIVGDVSGYTSSITIHTPGSGYKTGDVVTATSNGSYVTFAVTVRETDWKLSSTGNLTFPDSTVQPTAWLGYSQREAVVVTAYEDIAAGQAVMVHAITGGIIYAELADITEPGFNQESYLGIAPVAISSGTVGIVIDRGLVVGLDTSAYNEGDILWLNPDVPGGLIAAEPNPGTPHIIVGQVLSQSASNGSIYARADIRPYLNGLVDVNITNPTGGQVLVYSAQAGAWVNGSAAGGGGGSGIGLGDLSVNVVPGSGAGSLSYDNATGVFTFAPVSTSTFVTSSALNSYVLKSDFASSLSNYVTTSVLTAGLSSYVTSTTLSGYNYATQSYVGSQGFITSSALSTYINNTATNTVLGAVKVGTTFSAANDGLINAQSLLNGTTKFRAVTVPSVLTGAAGDLAGDVAFDTNYIYYCTATYGGITYNSFLTAGTTAGVLYIAKSGQTQLVSPFTVSNEPQPQAGWTINVTGYGIVTVTSVSDIGLHGGFQTWQVNYSGSGFNPTNGTVITVTNPGSGNIWVQTPWNALTSASTSTLTVARATTATYANNILSTATASTLGGVKIGSGISITGDGTISASASYTLTTATSAALGGVRIGSNLTADQYATISFNTATLVNSAINVVTIGSQNANASYYPVVAGGNNNNAQQLSTVAGYTINPGTGLVTVGQLSVTGSATASTSLTVKDVRDTVYSPVGALSTGNWTPDPANGNIQTYTMPNGTVTFTGFNNAVSGQTVTFVMTQPSSGAAGLWATSSVTVKYASGYKTLTTANGAVDMITISYIGTTYYISLVTNFV